MGLTEIFVVCTLIMIVLMLIRVWVGIAMAAVGFVGFALIGGWENALIMLKMEPYTTVNFYPIVAMPMFLFMGAVVAITGISSDLYDAARKWIGQLRGGLAMATVVGCGAFAAMCGDSIATCVSMGKLTYPQMRRHGYSETLASGCIAAGGTLGVLIPPSVMFILYGIFTETSIGALFIAGIIPGLLEILFYCITIYIWCRLNPNAGPPGPRVPFKEKVFSLKAVIPMIIIFLSVMAGIYGGIVTPTEAGALGVAGAIVVGLVMRRLKWKPFVNSIGETLSSVAMVLFLLIGAFIYMRFTTISQVPVILGEFVAGLAVPNWLILAAIMAVYIICGMFLSAVATMIITLPIVLPIILAMGYSPIWWGVIMVRTIEIAMITPPVGMNVFVLAKATNLPVSTIYKGIGPFVIADILHVALLLAVPELSLFLVEMMH